MKRGGSKAPDATSDPPAPDDNGNILNRSGVRQFLKAVIGPKQVTKDYYQELEAGVYRELRRSIIRAKKDKQLTAEHITL